MRREFDLPEQDVEYLDSLGLVWETIQEGKDQWIVIRNWTLPRGYKVQAADVALKIEPNYPDTQIDMAYFFPFLELESGFAIPRTQVRPSIEGREWQGWSRHRTEQNPWRSGVDYVGTHMVQVLYWVTQAVSGKSK